MAIMFTCWGILSLLLAIFLPPLGVLMHNGCGKDLIINILLTLLGYLPGIIHAGQRLPSPSHTPPHSPCLASPLTQTTPSPSLSFPFTQCTCWPPLQPPASERDRPSKPPTAATRSSDRIDDGRCVEGVRVLYDV